VLIGWGVYWRKCAIFLWSYSAYNSSLLLIFQDILSVPSSRVSSQPRGFTETSITVYYPTLRKMPKERRYNLHSGLKPKTLHTFKEICFPFCRLEWRLNLPSIFDVLYQLTTAYSGQNMLQQHCMFYVLVTVHRNKFLYNKTN